MGLALAYAVRRIAATSLEGRKTRGMGRAPLVRVAAQRPGERARRWTEAGKAYGNVLSARGQLPFEKGGRPFFETTSSPSSP